MLYGRDNRSGSTEVGRAGLRNSCRWSAPWRRNTVRACWRSLQRGVEAAAGTVPRQRRPHAPIADSPCAARIAGQCPGWLVLDVSRRGLRATVARLAAFSAGFVAGLAGRRGALAARWLVCWRGYPLAARLAWLLLGVSASPRGVWRAAQRVGRAAASYSEGLSAYHADSRSLDYQGAL